MKSVKKWSDIILWKFVDTLGKVCEEYRKVIVYQNNREIDINVVYKFTSSMPSVY